MSALIEFDEVCKYYQMGDIRIFCQTRIKIQDLLGT